ncbi:TPA: hypothetical protein SG275_001462 [Campylobacter coli]|nr:hypothetical protein [Campylobacter coli]
MKGLVYKSPLKVDLDLAESYKGNIFLYNEPIKNDPEYSIQDSINLVSKPDPVTFSESIFLDDANLFNVNFNFDETMILNDSRFEITSETIDSSFSRDTESVDPGFNSDSKPSV